VRQGQYVPRSARASLLSGYSSTAAPIAEANEVTGSSGGSLENGPVVLRGQSAAAIGTELGEDIASRLTEAAASGILSTSQQLLDTR